MIFFVLILLLIVCRGAKAAAPGEFARDYISKEKANVVKGIFVLLVLFSHASQYMNLSGPYDEPYRAFCGHLNQMVVVMFFFYSGYGIMESLKKKKFDYVRNIPLKRFLPVFLNFVIAVLLFVILNIFMGKIHSIKTILLSFIGWESVGNSNWYMFAIFAVYIFTFLSFFIYKWCDKKWVGYVGAIILTVLTMFLVFWEKWMGQPNYYYNTVLMFPLGCWYSLLRERIEKIVMKNDYIYSFVCMSVLGVYYISYLKRWEWGFEAYTVWAACFTIAVVLITMKISLGGSILTWFGTHIFSVYILQRLPMIVMSHFGVAAAHPYFFLVLAIVCTVFIAMVFDYLTGKLSKCMARIF